MKNTLRNPSIFIYPALIVVLKSIFMIGFGITFGLFVILAVVGFSNWFGILAIIFLVVFSVYLWYIGIFRKLIYWRFKFEIIGENSIKLIRNSIFLFSRSLKIDHDDDLIIFIRRWSTNNDNSGEEYYLQSSKINRPSGLYRLDHEFAFSRASFTRLYLFLQSRLNVDGFEYYQYGTNFSFYGSLDPSPEKANLQIRNIANKEDLISKYRSRHFTHPIFIYSVVVFGIPIILMLLIVVLPNGISENEFIFSFFAILMIIIGASMSVDRYYTMQLLIESSDNETLTALKTEIEELILGELYERINETSDGIEYRDNSFHMWYIKPYIPLRMVAEENRLKFVGPQKILNDFKKLAEIYNENDVLKIELTSNAILN